MKTKLTLLLLLPLLPLGKGLLAQDFHLTQHDMAPHYFNPALTANYFGAEANYRVYSAYRSQWGALGIKPFTTYYLAGDMPYKIKDKEFGFGAYLIHNRNGKGGLNTLQFMPSVSYQITQGTDGPHNLTVGLQTGIIYKSFDPTTFTYDNQYDPEKGFDQTMDSKEVWGKTSYLKFDANMGVFYKFKKEEWKAHPWGGFSVNHIPRPNEALLGTEKDKLPMRWVFHAGADWKYDEKFTFVPMLLYMNQKKAYDLNIGSLVFYKIKETPYEVIGGLNYRLKDAFIIQAGLRYEQHIFKISYDINTSSLSSYTRSKGGLELTLIVNGISGKPLFTPRFQ